MALMAKRQVLDDARGIGFVHQRGLGQQALTLCALRGKQVPPRSLRPQNLAGASDFESLGNGFFVLLRAMGFGMGGRKVVG